MSYYFDNHFERGFGTYPLNGDELRDAILIAADVGFRCFDTAQMYGNEATTGVALKETGIARDKLSITTKVNLENFDEARFLPSVERSLEDLKVDYVDVLLLHWPPADFNIAPGLELLARARQKGLARNIGISNYTVKMMHDALRIIEGPIACNQVEFHPLLNQEKLLTAAKETGIPLAAYCAVARGKVFDFPVLSEIGAAHGKSAAQVAQRWTLQKGVSINSMSTRRINITANFTIDDFYLSDDEMRQIDALTSHNHRIVNKSLVPWAPEFD